MRHEGLSTPRPAPGRSLKHQKWQPRALLSSASATNVRESRDTTRPTCGSVGWTHPEFCPGRPARRVCSWSWGGDGGPPQARTQPAGFCPMPNARCHA